MYILIKMIMYTIVLLEKISEHCFIFCGRRARRRTSRRACAPPEALGSAYGSRSCGGGAARGGAPRRAAPGAASTALSSAAARPCSAALPRPRAARGSFRERAPRAAPRSFSAVAPRCVYLAFQLRLPSSCAAASWKLNPSRKSNPHSTFAWS